MKQLKIIIAVMLITAGWTLQTNAQDNEKSAKLTDEQKRFDLNGDGKLSDEEDDLRLRVTSLEAFTGDKLSREEIKKIQSNISSDRGFGPPGGMPPFGGGRGGTAATGKTGRTV